MTAAEEIAKAAMDVATLKPAVDTLKVDSRDLPRRRAASLLLNKAALFLNLTRPDPEAAAPVTEEPA